MLIIECIFTGCEKTFGPLLFRSARIVEFDSCGCDASEDLQALVLVVDLSVQKKM